MPAYRHLPAEHLGKQIHLCQAELGGKLEFGGLRESHLPDSEIPLYLVEHQGYFGREHPYGTGQFEYDDNAERFCFFSQALLDGIAKLGWRPDVIHCHDWQTAPIPIYLRSRFREHPFWQNVKTLFTIHNLAFQGRYRGDRFASTGFPKELFSPAWLEYYGDLNLMKGAITLADVLTTVSPRYAKEIQTPEYGAGLDGMLRTRRDELYGILNGVDYATWNPLHDPHIAARFGPGKLEGKAACKSALQATFSLPQRPGVPLFGIVSRLTWQKGFDLFVDALDAILQWDLQIAILGKGEPELESKLHDAARDHPQKLSVDLAFDVPRSHQLQAGSDFLLMPSRYEPCGLSQMYALAYGVVPIVRRTGGLADTVRDLNPVTQRDGSATGISFLPMTKQAIAKAVGEAVRIYANKDLHRTVQENGMAADWSWERACREYVGHYREALVLQ